MKKKIYISGPISGHDIEERKADFARIKEYLGKLGYVVFNPMENGLPPTATTAEHMKTDIEALLKCDCIYMMKRWNHSAGCQTEFLVATAIGLEVIFEVCDTMPSSFFGKVENENGKMVHKVKFV